MVNAREYAGLYYGYRGLLLVTAYRILGDWQYAEDVYQEAFLTLWLKLQEGEVIRHPRSWIYRTTLRKAIDASRVRNRTRAGESPHPNPHLYYRAKRKGEEPNSRALPRLAESAENETVSSVMAQQIVTHIEAVTERYPNWRGLVEHKAEGMSDSQIANGMGVTVLVVKARLVRLRYRLRQHIASHDPALANEATA